MSAPSARLSASWSAPAGVRCPCGRITTSRLARYAPLNGEERGGVVSRAGLLREVVSEGS